MSLFEHLPGIGFPVFLGLYRSNYNKNLFFFSLLINILIKFDNTPIYGMSVDFSGLFAVLHMLQCIPNFRKDSSIHVIATLTAFAVYPAILLGVELLPGNTENLLCNFSISFEPLCWKSQLQDYFFLFSVVYISPCLCPMQKSARVSSEVLTTMQVHRGQPE